MSYAFPHFEKRTVTLLDGLWDFAFFGDVDAASLDLGAIQLNDRLPVPSAFDAMPAYAGKRGIGVYRRRVCITPGRSARLHFGAVSIWSRVYVDGALLKEHNCGFSGFWVDLPASDSCERTIVVVTDNRYNFERTPLHEEFFDFYQWGGIIRNVTLHELPPVYIQNVLVSVTDFRAGTMDVSVKLGGQSAGEVALQTSIDGGAPQSHSVSVKNGKAALQLRVNNPQPWSPATPKLYTLRVVAGQDDWITRFGLRSIETRNHEILLNGEPIRLVGYNRHESHPQYGPALPYTQLVADLQYLRDLGCNFIRGCHYPQDQRFLDLCDELGFLVWEESLGWGQADRQLTNPKFMADHAVVVEEMILTSFNHPSVIMWGFLNEARTDQAYVRPLFEQTVGQMRKLDPKRPITYASMLPDTDLHFDLADIISVNMYPGWYACNDKSKPLDSIEPFIRRVLQNLEKSPHGNKPFIISEIGVEALYGWHDQHNDFFSEDYQAEYLRRVVTEYLNNPKINGLAMWHFSDARTYGGGYAISRPRTFNNKGTLDEYRRPKQAYYTIRGLLRGPEYASRFKRDA